MHDCLPTQSIARCPVCNRSRLRQLVPPGNWIGRDVFGPYSGFLGLTRCRSCKFEFVNPRPGENLLSQFYSGDTLRMPYTPGRSGAAGARNISARLFRSALIVAANPAASRFWLWRRPPHAGRHSGGMGYLGL